MKLSTLAASLLLAVTTAGLSVAQAAMPAPDAASAPAVAKEKATKSRSNIGNNRAASAAAPKHVASGAGGAASGTADGWTKGGGASVGKASPDRKAASAGGTSH